LAERIGTDFQVVIATYLMAKRPNGLWRIAGCALRWATKRAR